MILADSSVWIDYFNGVANRQTDCLHDELGCRPVLMGDLILCEVLQGFRAESDFRAARRSLLMLPLAALGGREIALKAAENYRVLRRKGVTPRKTIDCIIATFCIEHKLALLHRDRDFEPFAKFLGLEKAI